MPGTDTSSIFYEISGFGENSRFRVKVLEHYEQLPIYTDSNFTFRRDNILIKTCKVWEFKTETSNNVKWTIWVRFMRRAVDDGVNLDFRIRPQNARIPDIRDDMQEVWSTRVGEYSSSRHLNFHGSNLTRLLFGNGNEHAEPKTLTFNGSLGLSQWGFLKNDGSPIMAHHNSDIFFFLSNCMVNGQAFPRFMIKKNFEALGQEPVTVEDYADPNSEQHYRYFLNYQDSTEGRRAFSEAEARENEASTGAIDDTAIVRITVLLDDDEVIDRDNIRNGLLWNSPMQANAFVRELDPNAWSYEEVQPKKDVICANHVAALRQFSKQTLLVGETKEFVDDEMKCAATWFFNPEKDPFAFFTEEEIGVEKLFDLSVSDELPHEENILAKYKHLGALFDILKDPGSFDHAPDTPMTLNYYPKRGYITEDVNKSGTVMYWDDHSVMMLSPTPYMARFHFLVWARDSKFVSPFHYLNDDGGALEILKHMESTVKEVMSKLFNAGVLTNGESKEYQLGFHYVGSVPRLHMHVLCGPITNEAFRRHNAQRWVEFKHVCDHWRQQ